jgi:hypothetical protein
VSFRLEDGAAICNGGIETAEHVHSSGGCDMSGTAESFAYQQNEIIILFIALSYPTYVVTIVDKYTNLSFIHQA